MQPVTPDDYKQIGEEVLNNLEIHVDRLNETLLALNELVRRCFVDGEHSRISMYCESAYKHCDRIQMLDDLGSTIDLDYARGVFLVYEGVSYLFQYQGDRDLKRAINFFEEGQKFFHAGLYQWNEGIIWLNLGKLYRSRNEWEQAFLAFQRSSHALNSLPVEMRHEIEGRVLAEIEKTRRLFGSVSRDQKSEILRDQQKRSEKALGDGQAAHARQAIERKFNPYISGSPVRKPDMFFGRKELLNRIMNTLHNNSIMIHGPRRIGKTSLLYQLAARLRATPDPDYAFIPALIDLEGTAQEEFFHTLMEEILEDCQPYLTEKLPLAYSEKDERAYTHRDFARDLRTLIGHLQQNSGKEIRLILLLDEVDVMNRYDQLVQQQLRRIFMKTFARNLGAVVAGVHISKEWDRLESPWYNLFLEMELLPLSREEAVRLIKEPVKGIYSYEEEAVEAIWEYSQGHPQLVQQLCLEAVNQLLQEKRSRVTKADVESVYRETVAWERVQEEREERERARPPVKRVAEEGPTYEADEDTDVRRDDR